ncbi:repressor LexA [Candidatus Daviesbacteria bacterium]|nr:repressor LexA [Candidatus Daviesbacteria bacterium]
MLKPSKGLTPPQQKIMELLRSALAHGSTLSMSDIADELGFESPNAVFYHIKTLENLGLIVRDASGKVIRVNSLEDATGAVSFLPLLGSARCGPPMEQIVEEFTEKMLPIPLRLLGKNSKRQLYLITAVGDSMYPRIQDGDIIIFEPNPVPTPNSIVVARTREGATVKRYKETGTQIILEPENPQYQPLVFDKSAKDELFNIDGVAVGVFKPQQNLEGGEI